MVTYSQVIDGIEYESATDLVGALREAIVAAAGRPTFKGTATAPPADSEVGDRWFVVATASGDFDDREGYVALWTSAGWAFRPAVDGEVGFLGATRATSFYDATAGTARALNATADTSEQDTGRLGPSGNRVWRKFVSCGAAPNTTFKLVAHGITGLPVAKGSYLFVRAMASNATTAFPVPVFDGALTLFAVAVNATYVVISTTFNATSYDIVVELEYER